MLGHAPAGAAEPLTMRGPTGPVDAAEAVPAPTSTPTSARRRQVRLRTGAAAPRSPLAHARAGALIGPTYPTSVRPTSPPPHANVTISGGAAAGASTSVVAIGDATVTVGGTLRIRAGSGTGAFALLDPVAADSTMSISANGLILEGGPGAGAYAAIVSNGGLDLLLGSGGLILLPGSGAGADAVIVAPNGAIAYTGTCVSGCAPLSANPLANNITEGGTFSGASGSNTPVQEVFIEVIKLLTAPPAPPPIIDPIDPVEPVIEGDKDVC